MSTETYSHPPEGGGDGVLLANHLRDVRDRVGMVVSEGAMTPSGESVREIVEHLALVHDIGKATKWFQQHIDVVDGSPKQDRCRYHAQLGAFAAYYILREAGYDTETCVAGFVAVGRHHGRLPKPEEYTAKWTGNGQSKANNTVGVVRKQAMNVHDRARSLAAGVFKEATGSEDAWGAFATEFAEEGDLHSELGDLVMGFEGTRDDAFSEDFYALVLDLWGSLVLADKTSAAGAPATADAYDSAEPSLEAVDEHVATLEAGVSADPDGSQNECLNYYRSRARDDVLSSVESFAAEPSNIATITLPTGMGKTLTGLSAALALRDELDGERVVYALPFTSIIDQVVAQAESVFPADDSSSLLATHHHLADTRVQPDAEAADVNDDIAGMLGESWRAGLTVSTFVQLFETLAGPRNTQSMKVPALRDSVVILDEPQSLPLDWWSLVPRLVEVLTEQYGATVISMTATQPKLFPDATELVSDADEYFQVAERVRYRLHDSVERFIDGEGSESAIGYDAAATELLADAEDDSVLAICNTIDSARELTDAVSNRADRLNLAEAYFELLRDGRGEPEQRLKQRAQEDDQLPFVHLSTRLRPTDRLALIRCVKELRDNGVPVVAVTTQLVEAGVDISFDRVYRDIAPVDSIVQAAGRCNRSYERDRGDVTVWWVSPPEEKDTTPAEAVYDRGGGPQLTPVAARALDDVRDDSILSDAVVARDGVDAYYDRLDARGVGRDEWAEFVDDADGDALAGLSLIDTPRSVDVLVCVTDADLALVDALEDAYESYDYERVDSLLDDTKPLRVSVPVYREDSATADAVSELRSLADRRDQSDIRVLRRSDRLFDTYFDETTGFVIEDSSVDDRFL